MFFFRLRSACVVVVHGGESEGGAPASALRMDWASLEEHWQKWLRRLAEFRRREEYKKSKKK